MIFITEQLDDVSSVIEEDVNGQKTMYIEGIFLQDTVKNRNGRMYPKEVMREAVEKYKTNYIDTRRSMSELNHPPSPQVNPERASHMVVSLKESGTNWMGRAKVLNTPMGNLVKNLMQDGVSLGVSSRGLGALKESNGVNIVQRGYHMTAIDTVSDPSAPEAFVNGIMENKEWIFEGGILVEKEIEQVQDAVNRGVVTLGTDEVQRRIFKEILMKL